MTVKTGIEATENSALASYNKITFYYSLKKKRELFYVVIIFQNITVFTVFSSNKCSLNEHKRCFQKHKILLTPYF